MFPSFIGILDIQSWWEVPSIAYFCSLFRTAFNLLDFDIEELEEALLTDGTEDSASSLLTELIVRLLNGCLGNNDISAFNYQMYLRRLFRRKCQETGRCNPFNTDIDFQFLPLRTKVEILYALCDFRLDADDVFELFKNLDAESLRVEPLGWDDNDSAYWYFYGTRLYREDILRKPKGKSKRKKSKKRGWFYGDDWLDDDDCERVWQVVCFTEEDWAHLTEKFSKATSKEEKELYRSLSQNFLPEIPRLFQEKERLQRKRLLELAPRRTSSRVLQKIKQKEEETKQATNEIKEEDRREVPDLARENRAKRRNLLRSKSVTSESSEEAVTPKQEMPLKESKRPKGHEKKSKQSSEIQKDEHMSEPLVKTGRKTNNSLASATGQIVIPDSDEPINSTRKKLKTSQIFSQTDEDIQTDMYKVLKQLTAHDDAWPFMDPVEEEYAPNYYAVIRRPMDLRKMEERLDSGYYTDFSMFKADFKLIVNNCRLYNGQDNEYTVMVDNLQAAFDRLTEKYIHRLSSSDEEIAVEFQLPTPSRKHKLKSSESPSHHKRKKRKSHSDTGEPKSSSSDIPHKEKQEGDALSDKEIKHGKESHKSKQNKGKKKHKRHHRHGKHSKNHKKNSHRSHRSKHASSTKSKHGKKQKHNKNKDSKKSKQKKKKNKHHESESTDIMKRSASQESLESSNRSRSASPLPSIHTPTPSPTELDQSEPPEQLNDPDFYKDKYDKIKERRRNAAKDAWESLFDFKQKTGDKQKQNFYIPEKDKNQKLKETIEKLKAKNEKYKDSAMYSSLFTTSPISGNKASDSNDVQESKSKGEESDVDDGESLKHKIAVKKDKKKNSAKNESASEALEQAVKDISKWFDDAPKIPIMSSSCDSPSQTISTEEHDNSRLDDEFSQADKPSIARKDLSRKRRSSREPKLLKRREIQRTIDRLQPGKSKGNLLTNLSNKNTEKIEEITPLGPQIKVRDPLKSEESSPKLSLGSVLPTVEFTLGNDHNFGNNESTNTKLDDLKETGKIIEIADDKKLEETPAEKKAEELSVQVTKKDAEVETEPQITIKPNQEKATPNLSAWFKAFGTPKNTTAVLPKKKVEGFENEEKISDACNSDVKPGSPKNQTKYDLPTDLESPLPDGRESPLPSTVTTSIQRRTSTGSSISERSSFSQDLDSPRHQMSHTSPLIQSPASPRTEDFQKITYPIINGTVRAGFYHDTTSIKSSPEKSCSPREAQQSPYSPYSQHVYVSNSVTGSSTPNYFIDHNKGSLPTYNQNPYYEPKNSVSSTNKSLRVHDDFTTLGPNSYPQNQYTGPFSSTYSPYSQTQSSNYTQIEQNSPQSSTSNNPTTPSSATQLIADPKTTLFPVKKRTYNEQDRSTMSTLKVAENKEQTGNKLNKSDCQKMTQLSHTISTTTSLTSVDDIALTLSEKSELVKLNNLRETKMVEVTTDNRDPIKFNNNDDVHDHKKDVNIVESNKPVGIHKKDNVDMVNMGYLNPDSDRRNNNGEVHEVEYPKEVNKPNMNMQSKGYDIDAIAINLGFSSQTMQNTLPKPNINSNIPPAHSQDRSNNEIVLNQNIVHAHHNQFESMANNFSLSDIDLANKKLFGCNTPAALDYGNWKMANPMRKQDVLPSDYSTNYNINNAEKSKSEVNVSLNTVNYNKNIQNQQYSSYNVARPSVAHRAQELPHNLPGELRIPNLRGLLKSDHMSVSSSINDSLIPKNTDTIAKPQKSDKLVQNHPLVSSSSYKTPYNNPSTLPLDNLHNLPNIPQMLERYSDERYLTSFATNSPSMYHEKPFQMAQMFNKSVSSGVHIVTSNVSIYTQSPISMSKEISFYKTPNILTTQTDTKSKTKRKRTSESKQTTQVGGSQTYHQSSCNTDVLSSVKTNMIPASTFNFGTSTNMALGSGLYTDNGSFSIEDFRNTATANQLMAANYMVAAVAHQQRNSVEVNTDKLVKPAHQNSSHTSSFPFIGHSQVRASYPFVGSDPTSPLYQQYLQRQEELLRQTGAQIMGLYPPGYPSSLGVRQSYDSINRPSWL